MPADSPAPTSHMPVPDPSPLAQPDAAEIALTDTPHVKLAKWILSRPDLYGPNDNSNILGAALLSAQSSLEAGKARIADLELMLRAAVSPLTPQEEDTVWNLLRDSTGLPLLNAAARAALSGNTENRP